MNRRALFADRLPKHRDSIVIKLTATLIGSRLNHAE